MAAEGPARGTPVVRSEWAAIFLLFLLLGLVTAAPGAALPSLRHAYGLSDQGGGWLVSAYKLGALAAILVCGFGNRYFSRKTALRALLVLFAAGAVVMGVAQAWFLFYAATVVAGAGYGGLVLYLNSIVAQRTDEKSFLMLNLINAVFGVGAIIGPLAVSAAGGYVNLVFLAAGVLAPLVVKVGNLTHASPARARRTPNPFKPLNPLVLAFVFLGLFYAGMETGVGAWEATHLSRVGYSASAAELLSSLFWVGLCVGRFVIPLVTRTRSPYGITGFSLVAATASLLVAASPDLAPAAYAACGFFLAPVLPAILKWIAETVEDNQTANSLMFTSSMVGSVLLPGFIVAADDLPAPSAIPFSMALIGVLAMATALLVPVVARRAGAPGAGGRAEPSRRKE
ncbi:MFS transporter [Nocardiopsis sp. CA-288880]|uniref:MFS transporter n=1 Tax=Nocardiopsis sp. CA-288880 TaxID=3239995 RepID=UPI003D95CD16